MKELSLHTVYINCQEIISENKYGGARILPQESLFFIMSLLPLITSFYSSQEKDTEYTHLPCEFYESLPPS